jgi:uncharacterized protein YoxC
MRSKIIFEVVEGMAAKAKDIGQTVSKGLGSVARKVQDLSSAVKESLGPSLSKASEKLPETIQAIPSAIKKAAGGAKSAIISRWEWVKKEVERRKK